MLVAKPVQIQTALLHDHLRRHSKGPWCPRFSVAVRILLLIRVASAVYSHISDCDEVYNFWEPLHYLDQGYGFQTWETAPQFSIRSWAYVSLHLIFARLPRLLNMDKRQSFFAVRMALGALSALAEARFYRTIVEKVNNHVGRYTLFFLAFSTGMWTASTSFLPSSFAMICIMMAFSFFLDPPSRLNNSRTLFATLFFAMGAIFGWPFSLAVAIPFVMEELFVYGKDKIKPEVYSTWITGRWVRLFQSGLVAALLLIPVVTLDTLAYGKLTITPWNIIRYNVFNASSGGPDLYGTEPWYFYILNLVLNFNLITPLALISLPSLLITQRVDYRRLGGKPGPDESSPYTLLALRLAPLYLWLGIMTLQPHKEERFMYPIYPLLCFNAAIALYLIRGWMEAVYLKATSSPYRAARTTIFGRITLGIVLSTSIISLARILALTHYYHAPMDVVFHLQNVELPRLLNVTDLLPKPEPIDLTSTRPISTSKYDDDVQEIDLTALKVFGGLTLCLGKEWYRFPGHYLVPEGVNVEFIKSNFDGMLPGHFSPAMDKPFWGRDGMRKAHSGLNDKNQEEPAFYVDDNSCDYLIDSDFPLRPSSAMEPRYTDDLAWEKVVCHPFLDTANSGKFSRLIWLPGTAWKEHGLSFDGGNKFGAYCLLRNKARASDRESKRWTKTN